MSAPKATSDFADTLPTSALHEKVGLTPARVVAVFNRRNMQCRNDWQYHRGHYCSVRTHDEGQTLEISGFDGLAIALLYLQEEKFIAEMNAQ
jgi:hypothetical protein